MKLQKVRKRKSRIGSEKKEGSPKPQWPPKRRHHKPQPTPEQQCVSPFPSLAFLILVFSQICTRLNSRHRALIQLGMINSPEDVPAFARDL